MKNSSAQRRSISALPRSFQVAGSVTAGASLVAFAAFAAVASAMRCSSSDISGVGAGEASAGSVETASGSVTGRFSTGVSAGLTRVLRTTKNAPSETTASIAKQQTPVSSARRRCAALRAARLLAARRGSFGWEGRWLGMGGLLGAPFDAKIINKIVGAGIRGGAGLPGRGAWHAYTIPVNRPVYTLTPARSTPAQTARAPGSCA